MSFLSPQEDYEPPQPAAPSKAHISEVKRDPEDAQDVLKCFESLNIFEAV